MRKLLTQLALTATCAVASALCLSGLPTHATTATGGSQLTLSPTKQRIDIEAGSTQSGSFTIRNTGTGDLSFRVYATPYSVANDAEYSPQFTVDKPRTQISRWVKFDQEKFTVAPGQKQEVHYRVVVPASIPAGSQYAALFAETIEPDTGAIVAKKRVGMLLYARPDGTTAEKGEAKLPHINMLQMTGSIPATTKVTNSGNTDFETTVKFRATSVFGDKEAFAQEKTHTILPETTRQISLNWQSTPPIGLYKITQSASAAGKITTSESTVLVLSPVILLIIIGVIIALIAWGVRRATRKKPSLRR